MDLWPLVVGGGGYLRLALAWVGLADCLVGLAASLFLDQNKFIENLTFGLYYM